LTVVTTHCAVEDALGARVVVVADPEQIIAHPDDPAAESAFREIGTE
jgi:hypothetical protein